MILWIYVLGIGGRRYTPNEQGLSSRGKGLITHGVEYLTPTWNRREHV